MKRAIVGAAVFAALAVWGGAAVSADSPLFLPQADRAPELMPAAEAAALKKEAEALKRKAELLKDAATKKYAAAAELRKKAGGFRSESAKKGEALRSKAEQSAAVSSMLGDMFSLMSGMGGMGGMGSFNSNAMFASQLTSKMIQGQQAGDAKAVMEAQAKSGQMAMEAEKKAGPLEMRADELENDGNRLMEAHNRLMGVANAKFLLVAADELLRKIEADSRRIAQIKDSSRGFLASMSVR